MHESAPCPGVSKLLFAYQIAAVDDRPQWTMKLTEPDIAWPPAASALQAAV
jgi:hypothetical protein